MEMYKLNQSHEPVFESKDPIGKQNICIIGLPMTTNIRNIRQKSLVNCILHSLQFYIFILVLHLVFIHHLLETLQALKEWHFCSRVV